MQSIDWLTGSSGLWLTAELMDRGLTKRNIQALVKSGRLVRLRRGCYMAAAAWKKLSPDDRAFRLIHAHRHATVATGSGSGTYSHTSAARAHQLYLWEVDSLIHLTQPSNISSTSHAPDVRNHQARLEPDDVVLVGNLPVTSLERTVVDCARILPFRQGLVIAEHALQKGASEDLMWRSIEQLIGHKGVARARKVMAHASSLSESPGETLTWYFLHKMRLPMPVQQLRVPTRNGAHRLDFAWKDIKLALEFDGRTKYFDYAPTSEVLFQERRREKALMEEGWTFIRIEWKDLFDEGRLKKRVLDAIARAEARKAA
ncbi:type IV toxin-antitoxin system AbiEi family antitoxin domain-containing protein [Arthrobacter subterraneus]|uniref:type IV toxin-antitoxin system AbiEi family antitoxin domain-containing protein n=1 Tax=Arthrobacter subterraneus TaxID=335973 RepID=UPI0037FE333C